MMTVRVLVEVRSFWSLKFEPGTGYWKFQPELFPPSTELVAFERSTTGRRTVSYVEIIGRDSSRWNR